MMIEKGKVYLPELERLYVKENYSIDLLSKVFGVSMPDISRILWKYNRRREKRHTMLQQVFQGKRRSTG